jgi:hypothetical protein
VLINSAPLYGSGTCCCSILPFRTLVVPVLASQSYPYVRYWYLFSLLNCTLLYVTGTCSYYSIVPFCTLLVPVLASQLYPFVRYWYLFLLLNCTLLYVTGTCSCFSIVPFCTVLVPVLATQFFHLLYGTGTYLFNLLASTPKCKFRVPQLTLHAGLKEGLFAVRFDSTSKQK